MTDLIPFSAHPGLRLNAQASLDGRMLRLRFQIEGDVVPVVWPAAAPRPERRDELWKSTCFEAFLQAEGRPHYWEINLSPAGHWNAYRFSGYRTGMEREGLFSVPSLSAQAMPQSRSLEGTLDLGETDAARPPLHLGLTAVIEESPGGISYWALKHAGDRPDFHLRETFLLRLGN